MPPAWPAPLTRPPMRPALAVPRRRPRRHPAGMAAAVLLLLPATARAQDFEPPVQLTLHGARPVRTVREWPGVSLSVGTDAHVAVFVVSRGRRDLPLQLLAPSRPGASAPVRRDTPVRLRALDRDELLHVAGGGDAPLLVAFASRMPPFLAPFATGNRWGSHLVLDTMVTDQQGVVAALGALLYPPGVAYDVVTSSASLPVPLTADARHWFFSDECLDFALRYRHAGEAGSGLLWQGLLNGGLPWAGWVPVTAMPSVLPSGMGSLFLMPVADPGAPGCHSYRVAWTPWAIPDATTGRAPGAAPVPGPEGAVPDDLRPRPPRYPGVGEQLTIDTGWRAPVERTAAEHLRRQQLGRRPEEATRGEGWARPMPGEPDRGRWNGGAALPVPAEGERPRRGREDDGAPARGEGARPVPPPVERPPVERMPVERIPEERSRRPVDPPAPPPPPPEPVKPPAPPAGDPIKPPAPPVPPG